MASTLSLRPLVIATAGHVNHGKTTLINTLTGINPDRLPEEKRRGMTLDLGFAHHAQISFIDCPGHEGLVRHFVSGQSVVDGALLIVAANEGLQEQTREHSRILNWLGVKDVLVVITKTDLVSNEVDLYLLKTKVLGEVRALFQSDTRFESHFFSRLSDKNQLINKILTFFARRSERPRAYYDRFFVDRAFSLNGIGTVFTGTLGEGSIEKGKSVFLWTPGKSKMTKIIVKGMRRDKESLKDCKEVSRLALTIDGAKPVDVKRGTCLLISEEEPVLTNNFAISIEWIIKVKKQFSATIQIGTLSQEVKLRHHPLNFWRVRSPIALPIRRHDRIIIRSPNRIKNFGHVIGGGEVLDISPGDGPIKTPPPKEDAQYIAWCRALKNHPPNQKEWALRLGWPIENTDNLLLDKGPVLKKEILSSPLDTEVLAFIYKDKWKAFAEPSLKDSAHGLVRAGLLYHIRELHFIHHEHFKSLIHWLHDHFSKKNELTIEDARNFFGTGRKNFLEILEFCDRRQFTFRKGEARRKFRLPPYSRPAGGPPDNEHAGDKRSGMNLY